MEFYRVEDEDWRGPYESGVRMGQKFTDLRVHPIPEEDGLRGFYSLPNVKEWIFGFQTMTQLLEWFHPDMIDYLRTARRHKWDQGAKDYLPTGDPYEFRVTVYEVSPTYARHGHRQSVAWRKALTPLRTIPLEDVYGERRWSCWTSSTADILMDFSATP